MTDVAQILGEFIAAWNAGDRPRLASYLERVDDPHEREELADQIETFLMLAPEPEYSESTWAEMSADTRTRDTALESMTAEPWPTLLPRLRERAGLTVAQVAEKLGFSGAKQDKAAAKLSEMEQGSLSPHAPTRTLLEKLGDILGVSAEMLDWRGRPTGFGRPGIAAAHRMAEPAPAPSITPLSLDIAAEAMLSDHEPWDDVDDLFLGGR